MLGDPNPEFGVLGADMTTYFDEDDSAEAMPGAWPPALDGGGGFYCLDLRAAVAGLLEAVGVGRG